VLRSFNARCPAVPFAKLLLAIADLASGEWPEQARQAAQKLSNIIDNFSVGTRLPADVNRIFDEAGVDFISSAELVTRLTAEPDSQWSEWKSGKPLTQNQLARLLKPFGTGPEPDEARKVRGYYRVRFEDPWERYLDQIDPHKRPKCPKHQRL
jgi:hypothetical protein